jgi:DNA end-binding protein Ku
MRPYWKGHLRLSLVTCPIGLFPATSEAEKTHFHHINRKTGQTCHPAQEGCVTA